MKVVLRCATDWSPLMVASGQGGGSLGMLIVCLRAVPLDTTRLASAAVVSRLCSDRTYPIANGTHRTRRKGDSSVGQVLGGDCGRGIRRPDPLCRRNMDHGEVRRALPDGYLSDQHHRSLPDRNPHDHLDGAFPTPFQLATFPGCGCTRRIHDFFELRIRDLSGRPNGRALVGFGLHGGQRIARIPWCLDGRTAGRPALALPPMPAEPGR